jgi:phage recombination protein Bet
MNVLVPVQQTTQIANRFSPDQVSLIKRTICKGSTDDELKLFMYQAERTGLDPLARQIYAVKRWDSQQRREVMGIQTAIDGFRLVAERTGKYTGQVGPYWCGEDGQWQDVWLDAKPPVAAKVGILRSDFKEPCWGVARFAAYAQKNKEGALTRMWANMGDVMIAKCAEALGLPLGLRKAFPQELSGLYTSDEMEQATDTKRENPHVTRAEDINTFEHRVSATGEQIDYIPVDMHRVQKLKVADARPVAETLLAAMRLAKTEKELVAWADENAEQMAALPDKWIAMYQGEYQSILDGLRSPAITTTLAAG